MSDSAENYNKKLIKLLKSAINEGKNLDAELHDKVNVVTQERNYFEKIYDNYCREKIYKNINKNKVPITIYHSQNLQPLLDHLVNAELGKKGDQNTKSTLSNYIKSIKEDEEMKEDYKEALLYIIIDAWDCNNSDLGGKSRRRRVRRRKTNKKKTRKAKKKTNKKKRKGNKKRKTRTRRRRKH